MTAKGRQGGFNRFCRAILVAAALLIVPARALSFDGPLSYRNQHPLFMHVNAPSLTSARPQNAISVNTSYSSVYAVYDTGAWAPSIDVEVLEAAFKVRKELSSDMDVGLEVPVVSLRSGFMDHPLNSYHSAMHFGDYGRSMRPDNAFLYKLTRNGSTVIEGEANAISIGDVRAAFKRVVFNSPSLVNNAPMIVSIEGSVELPTGNAKKGFGSGSTDAGIAVLADIGLSSYLTAYVNLGAVAPGPLRAHETVKLKGYYFVGAAMEAAVSQSFSAIIQAHYVTAPLPFTGIGALDRGGVVLTFGGRVDMGERTFEIGITEDPNTSSAPDFSATFNVKQRF